MLLNCVKNDIFIIKNYQLLIIFLLNNEPDVSKWIDLNLFLGEKISLSPKTPIQSQNREGRKLAYLILKRKILVSNTFI